MNFISNIILSYWAGIQILLSRRVPKMVKMIIVFILISYTILPIDLIPDFLPILGFVDELALIFIILKFIHNKYSKKSLSKSPVIDAEIISG